MIAAWCISHETALVWMVINFTDDKSTLVQVMAWCRQAPSHYLSQCWPRSMSPYAQWVNCNMIICRDESILYIVFIWDLIYTDKAVTQSRASKWNRKIISEWDICCQWFLYRGFCWSLVCGSRPPTSGPSSICQSLCVYSHQLYATDSRPNKDTIITYG